jgi:hypothetical protein
MFQTNRLRRKEAAEYIQKKTGGPMSDKTLAKLACVGGGPEFRKWGRVPLYEIAALDAWCDAKLSKPVRSTSELGAA